MSDLLSRKCECPAHGWADEAADAITALRAEHARLEEELSNISGHCSLARERAEAAEAELDTEHQTSRDDPAEQRAERYALEAADLTSRLIEAEHQVAALTEALRTLIDDAVGTPEDALWIVRRELVEQARAALAALRTRGSR